MKKIMKRLLTGVLTLATVFTALPVTQVHAADSVYTTTDGKAGTIVKIDNGGSEVSSFEESIMNADGQIAYCIDINTNFQSGYKNRINATERMSDDPISDVALNLEYVKQYAEKHSLSSKQVYLLEQCVVWRRLSVHLGWGYNNVRAAYDEVSEKIQSEVYEKNFNEIKSHHYIISFDPKDREECRLTGERAQQLGITFAKKNFPGHQALVCTHTDGHNESGNIHVHIVINSLRKYDVPQETYMEFDCESKAGYKHHLSTAYLAHLKQDVMDMCQKEGLHQVDLLSPAERKITEKEYWAQRRGQETLDKLNQKMLEDGITPKETHLLVVSVCGFCYAFRGRF